MGYLSVFEVGLIVTVAFTFMVTHSTYVHIK